MDGGTAQLKALTDPSGVADEFAADGPFAYLRELFVFPCANHMLNNAYKDLCKNEIFAKDIQRLRDAADYLSKSTHAVFRHCPKHITTRWLYDSAIMHFLTKHSRQAINAFLGEHEQPQLPRRIDRYTPLLRMLFSVSLYFEMSTTSAADVWPVIYSLIIDICIEGDKHPDS